MKEKNIIGLCQIFTFLLFKRRHFKKMKRQAIDRSKNVFQIHIFDTKQVSKIYKEPLQLNRKNNPKKTFLKWTKYLNGYFAKEDTYDQ